MSPRGAAMRLRALAASIGLAVPLGPLAAGSALAADAAEATDAMPPVTLSEGRRFAEQDGAALYRAVCQSCHMAAGEGARGAGSYPALAANPRLAAAAYPLLKVLRGRRGMPAFADVLSDEQVAAVTNHVRSGFGNRYADAVTAADVRALRVATETSR